MSDLIKQITSDLQKQIDGFKPELSVSDLVLSPRRVTGLPA
jgi:hypothetical protein